MLEAVAAAGARVIAGRDLLHLVQGRHVRHGDIEPLGVRDAPVAIAVAVAIALGIGVTVVVSRHGPPALDVGIRAANWPASVHLMTASDVPEASGLLVGEDAVESSISEYPRRRG